MSQEKGEATTEKQELYWWKVKKNKISEFSQYKKMEKLQHRNICLSVNQSTNLMKEIL